jgi:presequence protease
LHGVVPPISVDPLPPGPRRGRRWLGHRLGYLNEAELTRNIIGTIGEVDSYRLPDAKGFDSMRRYLIGDTDEARQRMREEILSTTAADIRSFADAMAEVAAHGRVVVLGSEQAIEAANAERPGLLSVSRVM